MANLIIKPADGGSLILQDEGGTAAHTIDASGNHTLSGTNSLGTISNTTTFPAGHVLQVVCGVERDIVSTTTQNWSDISTDLTVSITLSSASNKVLCQWNAQVADKGGWTPVTRLVRNQPSATTVVTAGTSTNAGSGRDGMALSPGYTGGGDELIGAQSASFLDTPNTTTTIEYKVQWHGRTDASGNNFLNRMKAGSSQNYYGSGVSSLTLFEVKA